MPEQQKAAGAVELTRIAGTSLYEPASPGVGERMWFLRWNTVDPPARLTLDDVWADQGAPAQPGYLVFFNELSADAGAVEQGLRAALSAPAATGIVWAILNPGPPVTVTIQSLLSVTLSESLQAVVAVDTRFNQFPGAEWIGFGEGSPLLALREGGFVQGLTITYPPAPERDPARGPGLNLPLTNSDVGCVQFAGLTNAPGQSGRASKVVKSVVRVSVDPLHPLDTTRNYRIFTGASYLLIDDHGVFRIAPVTSATGQA